MTTGADTVKDATASNAKRCPECGTRFGRDGAFCPFDGTALAEATWDPAADPLAHAVIADRYEVVSPLGEGGMGTVYKVRHMTLDRFFAMKVLRRELAKDGALAARFMQEAKATAAIRHPSIVAINDFGVLEHPALLGAPYFVMELLVGETLATHLHARGFLPPRTAAAIARRIAQALEAAHDVGVVHRDLKPENVFLVGGMSGKPAIDDVRIVDFGAAKVMGKTQLTRPGVVFGTPYYMSPEQASGAAIDGRADVYSLGVLLYEMITGSLPFEADTYMGVLTKHMFEAPTRPSERMTGIQLGALEDVVMRALEKEPKDRFGSMRELADALNRSGGASVAPARIQSTQVMPDAPPHPEARSRSGRPMEFERVSTADQIEHSVERHLQKDAQRKRRNAAIGAVAVIGTLGVVGLAISLAREEPKKPLPVITAASSDRPVAVRETVPLPEPSAAPSASVAPAAEASSPAGSATVSAPRPVTSTSRRPGNATPPPAASTSNMTGGVPPAVSFAPPPESPPKDDLWDPWKKK